MSVKRATFGIVAAVCLVGFISGCPVTPPPVDLCADVTCDEGFSCDAGTGECVPEGNDTARGGALYDKWWKVAGLDEPTEDHPLWASRPDMESNTRTGKDTWRCKECHGWDYKGVDGAYGGGSHKTGIAGLFGNTLTAGEAFATIKDDHGFGDAGLSDGDIWNLASLVVDGLIDTDDIIADGAFTGSVEAGQVTYDSTCAACHGSDGLNIPPGGGEGFEAWVGFLSSDNPWEFQHKVRFGQPATAMPAQFTILTTAQVGELGAHAQTLPTEPVVVEPRSYVGTDTCLTCHATKSSFLNTAHPYKLNKIVDGATPEYPFSTIEGALAMVGDDDAPLDDDTPDPGAGTDNTLGTPLSYDDVSYVIGGFGWKARWIDGDGYIVTGSNVQYNLETQAMASYHNNEVDKPYNCGNCHTTGWKAYTSEDGDDRNDNRQDDLPGMAGTFAFPGVQCEACHGAGSAHAAAPSSDNITKVAADRTTADFLAEDMAFGKAASCADCHTRDGEKDYPSYEGGPGRIAASGGFIRHHEQHDEMLGINPDDSEAGSDSGHNKLAAGITCITCHDPHKTVVYADESGDGPGITKDCSSCHADKAITTGGMQDLACIDCHMPRITKSAIAHAAVGTGPETGDVRTHIFRIDLTKADQFTEDGKFAYPWITVAYACKTCHNGVDATDFNVDFLSGLTIHSTK